MPAHPPDSPDVNDAIRAGVSVEDMMGDADCETPLAPTDQERLSAMAKCGLEHLDETIGLMEAAQDNNEARGHLVDLMSDESKRRDMAVAWRLLWGDINAKLVRLHDFRLKTEANQLRKILKKTADDQITSSTMVARKLLDSITRDLGIRGLREPYGYRVNSNGVHEIAHGKDGKERLVALAQAPIVICGRSQDVHDGTTLLALAWKRGGSWSKRLVERVHAMDARSLVKLSKYDAPVDSTSAAKLVKYLTTFEAENLGKIPETKTTDHMGWQDESGSLGFLLGNECIGSGEQLEIAGSDDMISQCAKFEAAGTWEGWLDVVAPVMKSKPVAALAIYAALASPLVHVLGENGFVVDWSCDTGHGKTISLRIMASVYGMPSDSRGIIYTWDTTTDWLEKTTAFLYSLPPILDDTTRVRWPDFIPRAVYQHHSGRGRGRGAVEGRRKQLNWGSVLGSTGEGPVTSFSGKSGTSNRALCLRKSPLGPKTDENRVLAKRLERGLAENYGHLGRRWIQFLCDHTDRWPEFRKHFRKLEASFSDGADGDAAGRLATFAAILTFAGRLAHEHVGLPEFECDAVSELHTAALDGGRDADRPAAALRDIYNWCAANERQFDGRGSDRPRFGAWRDSWEELGVFPTAVKEQLGRWKYDVPAVLEAWHRRGWLKASAKRKTKTVRVDGTPCRLLAIKREAIRLVMGDE
jgi:uncharacterized protein (DUF927 family)